MNELQVINDERFQIFSKENLGSVRTVLVNNEVWFCIKDICDILELTNPTVVAKRLDEDEKAKFDLGLKNGELTNFTNQEIGNILGVSKQKIGRLATKCELKSDKNGYLIVDKSPYSNKQVESFRYFEHAIEKFRKVLEEERELN